VRILDSQTKKYSDIYRASKQIENPHPRWHGNFPPAEAVCIEYLAKRGHFVNEDDRLEALQRNSKLRIGNKASTHNARVD